MANANAGSQHCGQDGVPVPVAHDVDVTTAQVIPHDAPKPTKTPKDAK